MTAIDLTRDQCVALANFLRRTVDRGMDSGYDEIELLVLAQRALRNAAKAKDEPPVVRIPTKEELEQLCPRQLPEGGGTVSAAREIAPARPSGTSEAARFKRETADRLVAYRSKWGPGCMGRLAALCGDDVNADKLTRMCDRERFPVEMWRQVAAALDKLEGGSKDGKSGE